MLELLMSEEVLKVAIPVLGAALLGGLGLLLRGKMAMAEPLLKIGVEIVAKVVRVIADRTPNKVDDKIALALELLRDFYAKKGEPLPAADEAKALALFKDMHGVGR